MNDHLASFDSACSSVPPMNPGLRRFFAFIFASSRLDSTRVYDEDLEQDSTDSHIISEIERHSVIAPLNDALDTPQFELFDDHALLQQVWLVSFETIRANLRALKHLHLERNNSLEFSVACARDVTPAPVMVMVCSAMRLISLS